MMSWLVGAGLGLLDFVAAGLEGNEVGGAALVCAVVAEPDEHAASATTSAVPSSIPCRVFIPLLLLLGPLMGRSIRRLADAA
jgi:hypothetical protein